MVQRLPRWMIGALMCAFVILLLVLANSTPAEAQGQTLNSFEQQVFDLVNQQRAANGLAALQIDWRLVQSARNHNAAMIQSGQFAHQVTGELPLCASGSGNDRYDAVGYPWVACGENIAAGQSTPQQVMNDWMNSSGHKANILSPNYRDFGIGFTQGGSYGYYWTQDFGTASGSPPPPPPAATATPTRTPVPVVVPTATPPASTAPLEAVTGGVFRSTNGYIYLRNSNTTGVADINFVYGMVGDKPVAGDWNGNGVDTIGVYRNGLFYLRNSNTTGIGDLVFGYGVAGDVPVVGDWNGDGVTTVGIFRNGAFALRNTNSTGPADITLSFGATGDIPLAGDWNGDGVDTIGVYRPSSRTFYLRNSNTTGFADLVVPYGNSGDVPVVGDWDGNRITTVGIYRSGTFYIRNSNTSGPADRVFNLGGPGDVPIAGNWDAKP